MDRHSKAKIVLLAAAVSVSAAWACQTSRVPADEADRIARVLEIRPGMTVADVGAGEGRWSLDLTRRVGSRGRVYATEVDEDDLEEIREHVEEAGADNVVVVEGSQESTGLPEGCCEAILLRRVYHHFTDPGAMHRALLQAMRPGARIAVIDFPSSGNSMSRPEGTPERRGGHGTPKDQLLEEMTSAGFEVVEEIDDWPGDDYCVVFRKPEGV